MPKGTLFFVVGPSGAGKDTLVEAACRQRDDLLLVPRIISRPANGDEHVSISSEDFAAAKRRDSFALAWDAHGYRYAVSNDICGQLDSGRSAILIGSRSSVEEAREKFQPLRIIHVTARRDVLTRRLTNRGREDAEAIDRRLGRAGRSAPSGPDVVTIDNSGSLDEGLAAFLAALA